MIRVIGANPAMDRVSTWPPLQLGSVNRARGVLVVPGGKGLNVARAALRLGSRACAYGFLGGHVGEALREMVIADGVVDCHTTIAAGTRVCFIVVEPSTRRSTVLNEPGPQITRAETSRFLDGLRADCQADDFVILSGSLPDSVDAAVAAEVVDIGTAAGARTIVDIHGQALREVVGQRPWMVKCNRDELAGLLGIDPADAEELTRFRARPLTALAADVQRLRESGVELVVVTLGADGAMLGDEDGCLRVGVPRVQVVNATGSGDVFLAGLVVGLEREQSARQAMALGAACGTVAATRLPAELPPDFDAASWVARIELETVPA